MTRVYVPRSSIVNRPSVLASSDRNVRVPTPTIKTQGTNQSRHHDISTVTGEEVVIFTLAQSPIFREVRKK